MREFSKKQCIALDLESDSQPEGAHERYSTRIDFTALTAARGP